MLDTGDVQGGAQRGGWRGPISCQRREADLAVFTATIRWKGRQLNGRADVAPFLLLLLLLHMLFTIPTGMASLSASAPGRRDHLLQVLVRFFYLLVHIVQEVLLGTKQLLLFYTVVLQTTTAVAIIFP